jgi:hypothetical protein
MKTEEILKLTSRNISRFLQQQKGLQDPFEGREQRRAPRWPFPGTVEICPVDSDGGVQWLGTLQNVSETGLGMSCEQYLKPDMVIDLAFHMPEASFYGKAIVRYCREIREQFMAGVEFLFDD